MNAKMFSQTKHVSMMYYSVLKNVDLKRHIYISRKACVRKLAVSKFDNSFSNVRNKEFHEENSDSFKNYFGIESDEGVLIVDNNSTSEFHNLNFASNNAIRPAEKFISTSFGLLRKDSENKPIVHGQFDPSEETDESMYDSQFIAKTNNSKLLSSIPKNRNKIENDGAAEFPSMSDVSNHSEKKYKSASLTKKEYRENLNNKSLSQDKSKLESGSETASYIDNIYFPDINNVNTAIDFKEDESTAVNEMGQAGKSANDFSIKESKEYSDARNTTSFIDGVYFSDFEKIDIKTFSGDSKILINEEQPTVLNSKFSYSSNQIKANTHVKDDNNLNFIDKMYFTDIDSSQVQNHITRHGTKNETQNSYFESNQENNAEKDLIQNQTNEFQNKSNYEFADLSENISKSQLQQSGIKNEKLNALNKKFSSMNDHIKNRHLATQNEQYDIALDRKLSIKSGAVEASDTKKIETAQDFIKNIRKNNIKNYSLLKEKTIASRETLDSKGFRILENQVLNLSYFTRDEVFEMLKKCVIYTDEKIVVLNKPYNLVIHDSQTTKDPCLSTFLDDLAVHLDGQNPNPKLYTIHRLDKETTGCLLLARDELTAQYLKSLFSQRKINKSYWIVTTKVPHPLEGIIDIPIAEGLIDKRSRMVLSPEIPSDVKYDSRARHGKRAISHYNVIAISGNAALVEVRPETGIKHQIRVHFGFGLGCPILGDHKYSHLRKLAPQKLPSDMLQKLYVRQSKVRHIPMHIHARDIVIPEYLNGRNLFVTAPLPEHMRRNLQTLKFRKKDKL